MVFALALAVFVTLSVSLSVGAALGDRGADPGTAVGRDHGAADVTFTKWVTSLPADPSTLAGVHMSGVVGGDVGTGLYRGLVLGDDTTSMPGFWLGHALYGFFGRSHSFVADIHITENDTVSPATAMLRGVVVVGWMSGARVTGQYTQWVTCPIATPGNVFGSLCFQGTLHLQFNDKRG